MLYIYKDDEQIIACFRGDSIHVGKEFHQMWLDNIDREAGYFPNGPTYKDRAGATVHYNEDHPLYIAYKAEYKRVDEARKEAMRKLGNRGSFQSAEDCYIGWLEYAFNFEKIDWCEV